MDEFFKKDFLLIRSRDRNKLIAHLQNNFMDTTEKCTEVIARIIRHHRKRRNKCMLKGHPILQIALKLCYINKIKDSKLVADLLMEVYLCEGNFERLFAGAVFGVRACYLTCNWKSDFSSMEENIDAVAYFIEHSIKSRCMFDSFRLEQVTMKNCGLSPLKAALQIGNRPFISLLAKFGFGIKTKRLKTPETLMYLCKDKILSLLWKNWNLPFGVKLLPLPENLINYLQLFDFDDFESEEEKV